MRKTETGGMDRESVRSGGGRKKVFRRVIRRKGKFINQLIHLRLDATIASEDRSSVSENSA